MHVHRERLPGALTKLIAMNMCGPEMMLHTAYLIDHCVIL